MDLPHTNTPFWLDEPDWLCSLEFLAPDDPEAQDETAETIGYLLGYAHMTNTRTLALLADPHGMAYEILFSFHSTEEKSSFLGLIQSSQDLGDDYIEYDLMTPTVEEILGCAPTLNCLAQACDGPCYVSCNHFLHDGSAGSSELITSYTNFLSLSERLVLS
jgi:hypothetical protein